MGECCAFERGAPILGRDIIGAAMALPSPFDKLRACLRRQAAGAIGCAFGKRTGTDTDKEADKVDMGLTDKLALVAGGSRGIGKAIALDLAREGADVAIAARNAEQLERTAAEIRDETGRRAIPLVFDATSTEQTNQMVDDAASQLGGLHILVNSASLPGGSPAAVGPVETVNEDDLLRDFDVKYVGALRCAKAAIPHLKQQGWGRIVNISGTNARRAGNLSGGARNTSMVHLTKTLALQLGPFGITVNCVHPGTTRTERTPGMLAERGAGAWHLGGRGGAARLRARLSERERHRQDGGRGRDRLRDHVPGVRQGLGGYG